MMRVYIVQVNILEDRGGVRADVRAEDRAVSMAGAAAIAVCKVPKEKNSKKDSICSLLSLLLRTYYADRQEEDNYSECRYDADLVSNLN